MTVVSDLFGRDKCAGASTTIKVVSCHELGDNLLAS